MNIQIQVIQPQQQKRFQIFIKFTNSQKYHRYIYIRFLPKFANGKKIMLNSAVVSIRSFRNLLDTNFVDTMMDINPRKLAMDRYNLSNLHQPIILQPLLIYMIFCHIGSRPSFRWLLISPSIDRIWLLCSSCSY